MVKSGLGASWDVGLWILIPTYERLSRDKVMTKYLGGYTHAVRSTERQLDCKTSYGAFLYRFTTTKKRSVAK